ncbi:MAG: putative porin, partial [Betaproteobacteria bacterium]|nr:putative porin [Betaproteobacteria bacterium]
MRRCLAAAVMVCFCAGAAADERQELEALRATTLKLIQVLVTEGVLSQERANALIKEAQSASPPPGEKPKPTVRVPYVPQVVKDQIKDELREEVLAKAKEERWAEPGRLPEWADRITISGDLRLRLQRDILDKNNVPAAFLQATGQNITNTTEDRNRLRIRAR